MTTHRAQGALRSGARPLALRAPDGGGSRARRSGRAPPARRPHRHAHLRQSPGALGGVADPAPAPLRHRRLGQLQRRRPPGGDPHRGRARGDEGHTARAASPSARRGARCRRAAAPVRPGGTRGGHGRAGRRRARALRGPPRVAARRGARSGHGALHGRLRPHAAGHRAVAPAHAGRARAGLRDRPPQGGSLRRGRARAWWRKPAGA